MNTYIIQYNDPEIEALKTKIASIQDELAEASFQFTVAKNKTDAFRSTLLSSLRDAFEARDRQRLVVQFRREFIYNLASSGEAEATKSEQRFKQAHEESKKSYESAAEKLSKKKVLNKEEEEELRSLWKHLVKLFHPDLVRNDPKRAETFHKLTQAINEAKSQADLETLREIAKDPEGFLQRHGCPSVDLTRSEDLESLEARLEMLLKQLDEVKEALSELQSSEDYKLQELSASDPSFLQTVIDKLSNDLNEETLHLKHEADELQKQIAALTGKAESNIV